jgi:hypothetical protein
VQIALFAKRRWQKPQYFRAFLSWHCGCSIVDVARKTLFMARKLYIFNPTGRVKTDASHPGKWVGGFTSSYAYLGDYHARMLGIGGHPSVKRLPSWLHTVAANTKTLKGGASRYDPSFRGWG